MAFQFLELCIPVERKQNHSPSFIGYYEHESNFFNKEGIRRSNSRVVNVDTIAYIEWMFDKDKNEGCQKFLRGSREKPRERQNRATSRGQDA